VWFVARFKFQFRRRRLAFASASLLRVNPQQNAYDAKEPAGAPPEHDVLQSEFRLKKHLSGNSDRLYAGNVDSARRRARESALACYNARGDAELTVEGSTVISRTNCGRPK
jgi:hypothetical protein